MLMKNGPVTKYKIGEVAPINMPAQYLKGWTEFYKLKFKVTPDVLIPRPETELLVDEVLNFVNGLSNIEYQSHKPTTDDRSTILDIGTGSGNIAISIAKNLKNARIFATDISEPALEIARENAKKNRVESRIFFLKSDLLSAFPHYDTLVYQSKKPDIIVANLPYIPTNRIAKLDPWVKDFEPRVALDGGFDGFDLYRRLFSEMKEKNIIPKLLVAEIDDSQARIALDEAQNYFPEAKIDVRLDLAGYNRILAIKF